jgi:hypothetical protein
MVLRARGGRESASRVPAGSQTRVPAGSGERPLIARDVQAGLIDASVAWGMP